MLGFVHAFDDEPMSLNLSFAARQHKFGSHIDEHSTEHSTFDPVSAPTSIPTIYPTLDPSSIPTIYPTFDPSPSPIMASIEPTDDPLTVIDETLSTNPDSEAIDDQSDDTMTTQQISPSQAEDGNKVVVQREILYIAVGSGPFCIFLFCIDCVVVHLMHKHRSRANDDGNKNEEGDMIGMTKKANVVTIDEDEHDMAISEMPSSGKNADEHQQETTAFQEDDDEYLYQNTHSPETVGNTVGHNAYILDEGGDDDDSPKIIIG